MATGIAALTDREKQTLRLIVRGHDAKSIARSLDLSVHTVNERLRSARRKLEVSSSREAARLLLAHEGETPQSPGHTEMGDDPVSADGHDPARTDGASVRGTPRFAAPLTGALVMSVILALAALTTVPQSAPSTGAETARSPTAQPVEDAARQWLELVDQSRWADSWAATGKAFRSLNTVQAWTTASERVRVPLGAVRTRTLLSHEDVPAPPNGYDLIKFRTSFANKADAIETLSLVREDGAWRVVGITVG